MKTGFWAIAARTAGILAMMGITFTLLQGAEAAQVKKEKVSKTAGSLIVWDGDTIGLKSQSWMSPTDNPEIQSRLTNVKGAGLNGSTGLRWKASGKQWKGFGLNWFGWYPANAGTDLSGYKNLVFWIRLEYKDKAKAPRLDSFSAGLNSSTKDPKDRENTDGGNLQQFIEDISDQQWHEVVIPLKDLTKGKAVNFDLTKVWEFRFGEWNMDGWDYAVYFDNIGFDDREVIDLISLPEKRAPAPVAADAVAVKASLDLAAEGAAVSPYIYGVSFGDPEVMQEMGVTIRRHGGNATSCYNWKTGNLSIGGDWFFINAVETKGDNWWVKHHKESLSVGMESYVNMPTEWVAKDATSVGFPGSLYPDCTEYAGGDNEAKRAGNGKVFVKDKKGKIVMENGQPKTRNLSCGERFPPQNGTNVGLEYNAELVKYCVDKFGSSAKKTGIRFVSLDNEPMLYCFMHRDMFCEGWTYDAYWERTKKYAELIKAIDPGIKIAAPGVWGWTAYLYGSADMQYREKNGLGWDTSKFPDFSKYGPFLKDFMRRCAEYEKKNGKKLIDIFDFHAYACTPKLDAGAATKNDPEAMEFRCLDIRKFWDVTYRDPYTWMGNEEWIKGEIAYVPLMRKWMKETGWNPEIAIGEYDHLSGGDGGRDISAVVAQAENFAAWARAGVTYAFYWAQPKKHTPAYFAWKMFRNPDGKHTAVGDRFIAADVSKFSNVSVYVFKDPKKKIASFILLNKKAARDAVITIDLKGSVPDQQASAWEFSRANMKAIGELPPFKVGGSSMTVKLPAMSVLRIDVKI